MLPLVTLEPFDGTPDVSAWFEGNEWVDAEVYDWHLRHPNAGQMHLAWFDGAPVAFVQSTDPDFDPWGASTVLLVVHPARRGEGIGAAALRALATQVPALAGERIIGKIYTANVSSIRCAERAAWSVSSNGDDDGGPWVVMQSQPAK